MLTGYCRAADAQMKSLRTFFDRFLQTKSGAAALHQGSVANWTRDAAVPLRESGVTRPCCDTSTTNYKLKLIKAELKTFDFIEISQ